MVPNYTVQGTPNSPVLVFSNSLGSTFQMWEKVIPLLLPYFQVINYDTRGHRQNKHIGQQQPNWSIADLGQDVVSILDDLGVEKAHFCGLSMGGLIGQWLAIHHSSRINSLIISNSAAKIGDIERWNSRIDTILSKGMESIVSDTMERWFTPAFIQHNPVWIERYSAMFSGSQREGYTKCCAAIRDADFREVVHQITSKTLVITGEEDAVTTPDHAQFLHEQIQGSEKVILPARHLSATELPEEFAETLLHFLVGESSFARGMHVRRTVLGDAHVDRANANINELNADFQRFITKYAWGEIWTRPGLSKHNRSLITLAMLIALNRKAEFRMHVVAAFHNGVTLAEIKEVVMQSGIYCGLPAANEALHTVAEICQEIELKQTNK